jgi:hypothetical protein
MPLGTAGDGDPGDPEYETLNRLAGSSLRAYRQLTVWRKNDAKSETQTFASQTRQAPDSETPCDSARYVDLPTMP